MQALLPAVELVFYLVMLEVLAVDDLGTVRAI